MHVHDATALRAGLPDARSGAGRVLQMGYIPVAMRGVSSLEVAPCVVCGGPMRIRIRDWSARCERCRSWASNLPVGGSEVHNEVRTTGLEALRRENFRVILGQIASLRPLDGVSLLDVGSAHGWFVEEATRRGARAVGLEPDARVASESASEVRVGCFPTLSPTRRCSTLSPSTMY